jgi:transcriptional regulator with XRE-family HTH domain
MVTIGKAIRQLRQASGLTQKELASLAGIHASYLSHVEADRREPSVTLLRALAQNLNVPPGLFLAILLSADLPAADQKVYQPIISRLIQLGGRRFGQKSVAVGGPAKAERADRSVRLGK